MTRQSAGYPREYTQEGDADAGLRHAADRASEHVTETVDRAQEMVGKVVEQAREYGEMAQDAARNFKPFVETSLKEQPMATLASAAVVGFVLGALWKK